MAPANFPPQLHQSSSIQPQDMPPAEAAGAFSTPRLDRWQRKLLDLSLRNNLLNFKSGMRFVELLVANPATLENALAEGGTFRILDAEHFLPPQQKGKPDSATVAGLRQAFAAPSCIGLTLDANTRQQMEQAMALGQLACRLTAPELARRLTGLYRSSRSAVEESGASPLFLALGFLRWQPQGRQDTVLAPLLLYPIRLEYKTIGNGVTLLPDSDEPRFNMTLAEALRRDYGITALSNLTAELPHDESGVDVGKIFDEVARAVKERPGWAVEPGAVLGMFSFARQIMWRDMQASNAYLTLSPVVRHLLMRDANMYPDEPPFVPADLLDTLNPADICCPLPYDSSQLSAVISALQGKDFVLVGPPGTGKSQTIANLIANAMAQGKRILFVAEKSAALNVVYRRLQQLGLGDLCLELHSNKASKEDVLQQLAIAATAQNELSDDEWAFACKRLKDLRDTLNAYVQALHVKYPNGLTPYEAIAAVLRNATVQEIPLQWHTAQAHTRNQRQAIMDMAQKLALQAPTARGLAGTALTSVQAAAWSPQWQDDLLRAAEALRECIPTLRQAAHDAVQSGWPDFERALDAEFPTLLTFAKLCGQLDDPLTVRAMQPDAETLIPHLRNRLEELKQADALWGRLSLPYAPSVLDADLAGLQHTWNDSISAWWPKNSFMQRSVVKELQTHSNGATREPRCADDLAQLLRIRGLLNGQTLPDATRTALSGLEQLGGSAVAQLITTVREINDGLTALYPHEQERQDARQKLQALSGQASARGAASLTSFQQAARQYDAAAQTLSALLNNTPAWLRAPAQAEAACADLLAHTSSLNQWCAWCANAVHAHSLGLEPLTAALLAGTLEPQACAMATHINYCRWFIRAVLSENPVLSAFNAAEQERLIHEFHDADAKVRALAARRVHFLLRRDNVLDDQTSADYKTLRREAAKKRRRMPVRQLISALPNLLTRLTPCLLMSPLSVAQYLEPGKQMFDLVVFDEASQIPIWDAIGAMSRGRRVVVVGDPKQLPPTSFFQRAFNDTDDLEEEPEEEMESILDECIASGLPLMHLLWHYRSRSESLISFSNERYYGGELVTFPAPAAEDQAVFLHRVEGVYDRGRTRTNEDEARHLVTYLLDSLRARPDLSYGVVTFNMQQQRLIEDMLDAARLADASLNPFFDPDTEEPLIVKNLENIQGDERDVMLFSLGFAPDANGNMTMNFGALNNAGGERRLNVAVTRAKRALHVFCSFDPETLSVTPSSPQGVQDLQLFLRYARQGLTALPGHAADGKSQLADPFVAHLQETLADNWPVRPNVGNSALKIDLGVVNPESPERFAAGIETDGAAYHAQKTARDREISHPGALEGLGWRLERAWSLAWWFNASASSAHLVQALNHDVECARKQNLQPASIITPLASNAERTPGATQAQTPIRQAKSTVPKQKRTQKTTQEDASKTSNTPAATSPNATMAAAAATETTHSMEYAFAQLEENRWSRTLTELVEREYPVHINVALRVIRRESGETRTSMKLKAQVTGLASRLFHTTRESNGLFLWPIDVQPGVCTRFIPMPEREAENIHELSQAELAALARDIPAHTADPIAAMCQRAGITRATAKIREVLETAWKHR